MDIEGLKKLLAEAEAAKAREEAQTKGKAWARAFFGEARAHMSMVDLEILGEMFTNAILGQEAPHD